MKKPLALVAFVGLAAVVSIALIAARPKPAAPPLWQLYEQTLKRARYVDLTHTINPAILPGVETLPVVHISGSEGGGQPGGRALSSLAFQRQVSGTPDHPTP